MSDIMAQLILMLESDTEFAATMAKEATTYELRTIRNFALNMVAIAEAELADRGIHPKTVNFSAD